METGSVLSRLLPAAALSLFAWIGIPLAGRGDSGSAPVKVVLVRERHVYLALRDSLALRSGDRVTFRYRKDDLAHGLVTGTLHGELAEVMIQTGSLTKVKPKDLGRIEVLVAERSQLASRALLRVGYPSAARSNLLFACARVGLVLPPGAYHAADSTARSARWVRDPAVELRAPWPDTLVARFFDDADDEEIALERGELDVAVFWPGELSRHMREQSRWQSHLYGMRSRGMVAAVDDSIPVGADSALVRLNRELFRGDLVSWNPVGGYLGRVRYEVDVAMPGWREMQRFLDRFAPPTARRVRLAYVDRYVASLDSTEASTRIQSLFLLRCPVVSSPELRPYLTSLDPDALVNALECRIRERTP